MTKKHFIKLADTIRQMKVDGDITHNGIELLAGFCKAQNSNFMRDRWINYINGECGKNGGTVKK